MIPSALATAEARALVHERLGVVIPVYLPSGSDRTLGLALLEDTIQQACEEMHHPENLCLAVDGEDGGASETAALAARYGARHVCLADNRGKFAAVAEGMRSLLREGSTDYLAVIDQDGDHMPKECLAFVRTALHLRERRNDPRVMVLGRRHSRHAPMGFLRGELEELADRVLLDALQYDAAIKGQPLALEYALSLDAYPDFHSGFKLFDRATAEAVFLPEPDLAGLPPDAGLKHGCEAMMTVESLAAGAYFGSVHRSTVRRQPISLFATYDRIRMVVDKILWPCRRLNIPPPFAAQWLDNHLPHLLLGTLAPEGRKELEAIRTTLWKDLGLAEASSSWLEPGFL